MLLESHHDLVVRQFTIVVSVQCLEDFCWQLHLVLGQQLCDYEVISEQLDVVIYLEAPDIA